MPSRWTGPIPIHPMGFAPDLPIDTPGILQDSANVFPTVKGVRNLPGPTQLVAGPLVGVQGVYGRQLANGAWKMVAGTNAHLYFGTNGGNWAESDSSQTYTGTATWSFAQRGNDIYATHGTDAIQVSRNGGNFAALPATTGSVPIAKFVVTVEPGGAGWFLFALNLSTDQAGWSATGVNNDGDWGYSVSTLSATGTLGATPGPITAVVPFGAGLVVFKQNSLYSGQFIGSPWIWSFQPRSYQQGTQSPYGIAQAGDKLYFIGADDFYEFDGYTVNKIPNMVREWFFTHVNLSQLNNIWTRYDPSRDCVFWYFASTGQTTPNTWLCWYRRGGRWTKGTIAAQAIFPISIPDTTQITNGAYVDAAGAVQSLSGTPGLITSGAVVLWDLGVGTRLITVSRFRPYFTFLSPGASVNLTSQIKNTDTAGFSIGVGQGQIDANGYFNFVQTARRHQFALSFTGDAELQSVDIETSDGGTP